MPKIGGIPGANFCQGGDTDDTWSGRSSRTHGLSLKSITGKILEDSAMPDLQNGLFVNRVSRSADHAWWSHLAHLIHRH